MFEELICSSLQACSDWNTDSGSDTADEVGRRRPKRTERYKEVVAPIGRCRFLYLPGIAPVLRRRSARASQKAAIA